MAFVRGLMGPYMRPIPIGASSAMMFSSLSRCHLPLGRTHPAPGPGKESGDHQESRLTLLYRRMMGSLSLVPGTA